MLSVRRAAAIGRHAARELVPAAAHHHLFRRWPRLASFLAGPPLSGPYRLRRFFERCGGAFIKLGQLLALQPDMLPRAYCNALYDLLDRIEPCEYEEIAAVFAAELGLTPEAAFERFERAPLSTASIGQVHVAFRGGRKYAAKIRRPAADLEFARDIELMEALVRLLDALRARRFYWLKAPIAEFIEWTSEELDYRQEARYMQEVRLNSRDDTRVKIPEVDWSLTTRRTLVSEYCEGMTVLDVLRARDAGDAPRLLQLERDGFDSQAAARNIIDIFLRDAFVHGLFHADLHPANLLILPGNTIGYVDFGITGALSITNRRRLVRLTLAWSRGDVGELCETFIQLSKETTEEQRARYRRELEALAAGWYDGRSGGPVRLSKSFTVVALEMLALCHRVGLMPDRSVSRYLRSAMAADGLVKRFAPELDVAAELETGCRRYLAELTTRDFFSFENAAWWASLPPELLRPDRAHPPAGSAYDRPAEPRRDSRAVRLGLVGLACAAAAVLLPGGVGGAAPAALALGMSVAAVVLGAGALLRPR